MTDFAAHDGIERLILDRKGDRTYDRLSRDCGGVPSDKRLHQMATRPIRNFPDPDTIQGLARGLNVSALSVLVAIANSLGIKVTTSEDPDALVLVGAGALPSSSQEVLVSMSRELLHFQDMLARDEENPTQDMLDLAAHKGDQHIGPYDLPNE